MTRHIENHPRNHEHAHRDPDVRRDRHAGARVLDRVDVRPPRIGRDGERQLSLTDELRMGTRNAALDHLRRVRDIYQREKGVKLPMNTNTVRLAYIAQNARLNDERITDDMTRSQLTHELMAKAVLFAPQVSDALKHRRRHESKAVLSQYNDMVRDIVRSLPPKLKPGYKTAIVEALKLESLALNKEIGHSSEISGKDPETRIDELTTIMNGISYEVAPENGLRADPRLDVAIPDDTDSDLEGIDMIVTRKEDDKTVLVDTKTRGSYLRTIAELQGLEWVDAANAPPYYFTEMKSRDGRDFPHYILNANSFGEIPAEGFDYTPTGQDKLRRTIHQMLDE